jgi:cytidylate kinase
MSPRSIEQIIERQLHRWDSIASTLGYEPARREDWTERAPTQAEIARQPVICVTRNLGSGAREIARDLARELNYEIFGRTIIDHIARDMNVQRRIIDTRDERFHSSIEVLVDSWLQGRQLENEDYLRSLTRVIQGIARKGGVIFLGRGANFILGERAALRLRVMAPRDVRIRRLALYDSISEEEAAKSIDKHDRGRRDFIRQFFAADIDDPIHSDLSINTGRIEPRRCLPIVLRALEARGIEIDRHRSAR